MAKEKTGAKKTALKKRNNLPKKSAARDESIADKKVTWSGVDKSALLRWLVLIPLAAAWFLFQFVFAGYSFSALVCCALMGIILFYNVTKLLLKRYPKPIKVVRRVFTVILCIGLLVCGITEALIIKASFGDLEETCDYVVVLGAKVRNDGPSVSLQNRIDAAYAYLIEHPDVIAVVSGGKGADEPLTEAECMYNELVEMGIDPSRVWMEDQATSTWENLHFSLDLIEAKTGVRPGKIGLLSSEYHLFRAKLFADACDVEAVGIPAHTTKLSQMINHFMREVAGVWHYILLGGQYSD